MISEELERLFADYAKLKKIDVGDLALTEDRELRELITYAALPGGGYLSLWRDRERRLVAVSIVIALTSSWRLVPVDWHFTVRPWGNRLLVVTMPPGKGDATFGVAAQAKYASKNMLKAARDAGRF